MNTVMRKAMKSVVQGAVAAAVLVGAFEANAADCGKETVALIGQMEVVAPVVRVADLGSMVVTAPVQVADLGSMVVTATRETALAARSSSTESTGEATETR